MACAHAKFTGEVGRLHGDLRPRCDPPAQRAVRREARSPAGRRDRRPAGARPALGGNYQQEVDLRDLFKDVAHEYVQMAIDPAQIRHLVDRAMRIALAERTRDRDHRPERRAGDGRRPAAAARARHGALGPGLHGAAGPAQRRRARSRRGGPQRRRAGRDADRRRARCARPTRSLAVADALGAGVAKALLGKAALPDDLPYVTGSIGLLGTKPSWDLMQECDTLLMVGSSFPYSEFLPEEGRRAACRSTSTAGCSASAIRWRSTSIGDSAETLRALLPRLAAQAGPLVARADRERGRRVVEADRGARAARGRSDQPAARLLGALAAPSRRRDHRSRTRARRRTGSRAT